MLMLGYLVRSVAAVVVHISKTPIPLVQACISGVDLS